MSYIHSLGMMNRNLKLENIMLNHVFETKVIDFGLIHVKKNRNFAYMLPEMVNEEDYTNKTDVYSYGIILFALFIEFDQTPRNIMLFLHTEYIDSIDEVDWDHYEVYEVLYIDDFITLERILLKVNYLCIFALKVKNVPLTFGENFTDQKLVDLITKMLEKDADKRIAVKEVFKYLFFDGFEGF